VRTRPASRKVGRVLFLTSECQMTDRVIQTSKTLADVKYEIRGQLAHRAGELEKQGFEILSLNIGTTQGYSDFVRRRRCAWR